MTQFYKVARRGAANSNKQLCIGKKGGILGDSVEISRGGGSAAAVDRVDRVARPFRFRSDS